MRHRGKQGVIDIINMSWIKDRLPSEWKRAIVIPIKKLGSKTCAPEDFRPIALTYTICKLVEKIILIVRYFLYISKLKSCEEYDFRRGHGTID